MADTQLAPAQAMQEIFQLIDRLDGRRWIVDGRRQRLDGDIHQEADRIFGVLFEGALRVLISAIVGDPLGSSRPSLIWPKRRRMLVIDAALFYYHQSNKKLKGSET
jgi:hypothetical protein